MKLALYRIVKRQPVFVQWVPVPDDLRDFDSWLHANGYGPDFTLRRGIIREETPAERRALAAEHDRLKAAGLLPSALETITGRMTRGTC